MGANEKELVTRPQPETTGEPEKEQVVEDTAARETGQASQAPSEVAGGDLPADLATAYRKLVEEKRELYDRLLRKQAELENFRKRIQREKEEFLQHATADLIRALLPVLDSFERALQHRNSNVPEDFNEGVELIYRNLLDVLTRAGLTAIETAGKLFDPHLHQAVETVEQACYRDQEIVEELQRGYKLKHRLLRPSVVKVAVAPSAESTKAQPEERDQENKPANLS